MLPNVLRRGSAYLLALTVTQEEREARMGHAKNGDVYWESYRNTTSTVDFQAKRLNLKETNVEKMSSVFLNTNPDEAPPARVSDRGMAEVLDSPELKAMSKEQSGLLDELLAQYGSLETASTQSPALHDRYQAVRKRYCERLKYLQIKQYKSEYQAWWASKEGRSAQAAPQPLFSGGNEIDQLLEESQGQENQIKQHESKIDPQLLDQELAEESDAAASLAAELDSADRSEPDEDPVEHAEEFSGKIRTFIKSESDVPRHTLIDDLPALLYNQQENTTWVELSAACTTIFNHLHPIGRFYPNQEPLPGTWECRFCGVSFLGHEIPRSQPPEVHSHLCEASRLARHARSVLASAHPTAVENCPLGSCSFPLEGVDVSIFDYHVKSARSRHHVGGLQPAYVCTNHEAPLSFQSLQDFRVHAVMIHAAPVAIVPRPEVWQGVIYFCYFCQVFVQRKDQTEEDHLRSHINANDVVATITQHGITGRFKAGIWSHPGFCIFCLYNARLTVPSRYRCYSSMESLLYHMSSHVHKLKQKVCCPAAVEVPPDGLARCNDTSEFDATELSTHLLSTHNIRVTIKSKEVLDPVQSEAKRQVAEETEQEDSIAGAAKRVKPDGKAERGLL